MNKVKLFTLLIFFISLFGMVSCNNDDPVDKYMPPTPDEVKAAFERVKGNYTGKLVYEKENFTRKSSQNDTVDINCQITNDSTFIIKSFPSKLLALNVKKQDLERSNFQSRLTRHYLSHPFLQNQSDSDDCQSTNPDVRSDLQECQTSCNDAVLH